MGRVPHVENGLHILKPHPLCASPLLRHVVDTEELVVAEKCAIHRRGFHCLGVAVDTCLEHSSGYLTPGTRGLPSWQ